MEIDSETMSKTTNNKRTLDEFREEEKKISSPRDNAFKDSKQRTCPRGRPLVLNVREENETEARTLLVNNFGVSENEAKIILATCRLLEPEDPAMFVSFRDAARVHEALSLPGPGKPCPAGADADASFRALKDWVDSLLPTDRDSKAVLISGGANAVAFGNLAQAEYNEILPVITHHPDDFTWVAAVRAARLSCGKVLTMTGTGVEAATIANLPSTIFFDD